MTSPLPAGAQPFVDFGRLLHDNGFPTTPDQTIALLKAVNLLGPRSVRDIYWAARTTLAPSPDRTSEFDALFDAVFRGATGSIPVADPSADEESAAADSGSGVIDPTTAERSNESGATATAAEALGLRRFADRRPMDRLRLLRQRLAARAPHRRGYRHASANKVRHLDLRRTLSRMVRGGADAAEPAWTRRRDKLRRVLLLIDISGSMKAHTDDYLRFAHAVTQTLPGVETFSFGTRLTRLTRSLRHKDVGRALAEIAPAVADWNGGTRIADSIDAFLAIPRFSRASRGALVVVLSDGLERGDAAPMAHAVRRLAARSWRLAWLTPLAADPGFKPATEALTAILPIVDHLGDGSGIGPLCDFLEDSAALGRKPPAAGRASASLGKKHHGNADHRRPSPHLATAGPAVAGRADAAAHLRTV